MRTHDPDDEDDRTEAERSRIEPWMLEAIALNPEYVHWGPHEDYMWKKGEGWDCPVTVPSWSEFSWTLDELNECANFYFYAERDSQKCAACDGGGYNPETHALSEDFYDFAGTGRKWNDKITQDEVDALWAERRLHQFNEKPTPDLVNARQRAGAMIHDAINRWILIETRAKRLGVYGQCAACDGHGYVFTAEQARLGVVLWMLHPRKGCSRGVDIQRVERDQVPSVRAWLRDAAQRNAERFGKL
jgi:hypothetical protein